MKRITINNFPELPFDMKEAINQLRINLEFCGSSVKTVMITSSVPNEGKSFLCMCLWYTLSQLGNKVLLIDCDLRNSEIRSKYGITSDEKIHGIVHYLSGRTELSEAIYGTNVENGFMMPAEGTVPNPSLLLEGASFDRMVAECAKVFDYIIIDTPPLGSVADAMKIATHCDGSLLVIRSGATPRRLVFTSLQQLKRTGKPVLGTVLNRISGRSRKYYNRRYYRYGGYKPYKKSYGVTYPPKTGRVK